MEGTVKWFNAQKGYGFLVMEDGKDIFVHYSGLNIDGFKVVNENEIVEFDVIETEKGKQAVNVTPILTMKMIRDSLKKDNLYVGKRKIKDAYGVTKYLVVDQNNVIQSPMNVDLPAPGTPVMPMRSERPAWGRQRSIISCA